MGRAPEPLRGHLRRRGDRPAPRGPGEGYGRPGGRSEPPPGHGGAARQPHVHHRLAERRAPAAAVAGRDRVRHPAVHPGTPAAPCRVPRPSRSCPCPVLPPVPAFPQPVSRPSVPAASNVLSLTKGTQTTASPGQAAGQKPVSLSSRAAEVWLSGWDKDTITETLNAEYVSPDGTPAKPNTVIKAVTRAEAKHPRP